MTRPDSTPSRASDDESALARESAQSCDPALLRDVVAIDGPSGAGKSTVARQLARRLGCTYLDTGAMYRAVTWHLLAQRVSDLTDADEVDTSLRGVEIGLDRDGRVLVDGKDVSAHLRSHEVESRVSAVSALPTVRARMRALQRELAKHGRVVAEGRDMGSVVFPAANWKFYLDADPAERARRRAADFRASGREVSEADVLDEIVVRDRLDSTRRDAPLVRAEGARLIETTALDIDGVVTLLERIVRTGPSGEAIPGSQLRADSGHSFSARDPVADPKRPIVEPDEESRP